MQKILNKIENSFQKIKQGSEDFDKVIWLWGGVAYVFAFFILDFLIKKINFKFIDILISIIAVSYFIFHIYALKKCAPKKPELTKEEKQRLKRQAKMERGKRFLRKLFLQEPLTKTNPVLVVGAIDLFFIAHFGNYIF